MKRTININNIKNNLKVNKQFINKLLLSFIVFYFFFLHFILLKTTDAEPLKIAVMPFEINSGQNLDFLKQGIQDMLSSRLSFKDEIKVIDKEDVEKTINSIKGFSGESSALLAGGRLKADFVIYGSLTIIGNSTSIDSKFIDVSGKHPPISFFKQTEEQGGVIPAINQFATSINETIFNKTQNPQNLIQPAQLSKSETAVLMPAAQIGQKQNAQINSNFVVKNDENPTGNQNFINPQAGINAQSHQPQSFTNNNPPNPQFAATNNVRGQGGVWKSHLFKHVINGISIGNTDTNPLNETLFISDHNLYIYRFSNNNFIKITELPKNRLSTYISVDTGDINSNGVDEIFVTSLNPDKNMPDSFVVEYDGNKYVTLLKNIPWYFKIIETKKDGKVLLGQKQKSDKDNIYTSPIYKMKWDSGQYVPSDNIFANRKANILGFTLDNITGSGSSDILAYDKSDHLTLFSPNGGTMWRDVNKSGGNINYFHLPKDNPKDDNPLQYFPLTVRSADINRDGSIEVLYASNSDIAGGYLSKFRRYSKGIVNCAFWNGTGLSLQWSTPDQTGRVSDFVIGDFDNNGAGELVIANVIKDSLSTFSNSESIIIVYSLMQ